MSSEKHAGLGTGSSAAPDPGSPAPHGLDSARSAGRNRRALEVAPPQLAAHTRDLLDRGFRLRLVAGHHDIADQPTPDSGAQDGSTGTELRAVYLFAAADPDRRIELHVRLDETRPAVPSLAGLSFPAGRFEREMRDLFGIVPTHHPLPRRLVRHFHWPKGWYPMLRNAGGPPAFSEADGPYPFRAVEGQGVFEIPVGPVHAGMIGPGHFRFSVVGETILNLKARLWFTHRGIEKLFEGRHPDEALRLAERISGDSTVGHATAFCQAIEDSLGVELSPDAARLRGILLELERIHNHITDLGALCNDVGHGVLNAQAQRIREQLLRLNEQVSGSRLLRGAVHLGGATLTNLPSRRWLAAIDADIAEVVELALSNSVVRDRFTGTAVLSADQAADLGALGYVARASGLTVDARHDHPSLPEGLARIRHTSTTGDVLSRFLVRAEEITASVHLIGELVETLHGRTAVAAPWPQMCVRPHDTVPGFRHRGAAPSGVGIVEGWRGTITHRVELTPGGSISRLKIVDPSFFNWPALPVALAETIVPDFPLVNKSFNASYPGNDL